MQQLDSLADDFNVRVARKLYQLARARGLKVTQEMVRQALAAGVRRQVFAPKPRSLEKSAAEGAE